MAFMTTPVMPTFESILASLAIPLPESGVTAEVFREAVQSQNVSQQSRAFAGAQVGNSASNEASLQQDASAENRKEIQVDASSGQGTDAGAELFGPRVSLVSLGAPTTRSAAAFFQDQGGDQAAFAGLYDAQGNPSSTNNDITQSEDLNAQLAANSELNVTAPSNPLPDQPVRVLVTVGSDTPSEHLLGLGNVPERFRSTPGAGEEHAAEQAGGGMGNDSTSDLSALFGPLPSARPTTAVPAGQPVFPGSTVTGRSSQPVFYNPFLGQAVLHTQPFLLSLLV